MERTDLHIRKSSIETEKGKYGKICVIRNAEVTIYRVSIRCILYLSWIEGKKDGIKSCADKSYRNNDFRQMCCHKNVIFVL